MRFSLHARMTAEFVGTAFLLAAVVGSGIMGERLSAGNVAIALLANTVATGAALVALILTFGPISGAAFQSSGDACGRLSTRASVEGSTGLHPCPGAGCICGCCLCSLDVWAEPLFSIKARSQWGVAGL